MLFIYIYKEIASAKLFGYIVILQNHGYIKIMIQNSRFFKNMLFFLKKNLNHFISLIVSFFLKKILLLGQSNKFFPMKS
jgi:hypothetical protein